MIFQVPEDEAAAPAAAPTAAPLPGTDDAVRGDSAVGPAPDAAPAEVPSAADAQEAHGVASSTESAADHGDDTPRTGALREAAGSPEFEAHDPEGADADEISPLKDRLTDSDSESDLDSNSSGWTTVRSSV